MFSICAFATVTGYSGTIVFKCSNERQYEHFSYPFEFHFSNPFKPNCTILTNSVSTSDAKFFVTTGVLTMLYAMLIIAVYAKFDEKYKSNHKLPLIVSEPISNNEHF